MVRVLDRDDVRRLVGMADAIAAVREGRRRQAAEQYRRDMAAAGMLGSLAATARDVPLGGR